MVRNLRDLAGFTKVHLAPGQSSVVELPLRLCDLARYDEDASWTNRKGAAVTGAYVVDGGDYTFYAVSTATGWCHRERCRLTQIVAANSSAWFLQQDMGLRADVAKRTRKLEAAMSDDMLQLPEGWLEKVLG